ncbi:MAG TPA: DUF1697 domain-containing protein [Rhodoferax sp.]|nr:DUF1697 domain-containing protein [Rhodoferax sp.]
MVRYVAFLRGVSPMNARMPQLKRCFEIAGFSDVRTLLSSGNVVFSAQRSSAAALQRRAEEAMQAELGRSFGVFLRAARHLQDLIEPDPYAEFKLPVEAKRIVTFLRTPGEINIQLPIEQAGACILKATATEVLSAYVPSADGPVFMRLLERTFGASITTRTLYTVRKCAWG